MSFGMSAFVRPLVEPVPGAVGSCELGSGLLWPRLAGILSQLVLHRLCQCHQTRKRPDHHVQLVDQSLLIDVDEIAALERTVTDTTAEDERVITRMRGADLPRVAEVLEHLAHRAEQRLDLVTALVGRVNSWAAEQDFLTE
jgi:hypothetical protein